MTKTNGGALFVDALKRLGVDRIFSLSGGHITPIHMACKDQGFEIVDTRHEQAAGFMAEAWGRITRKPGIALVTAGPGFTNVITAAANARMANSPMVIVSGRVGLGMAERLDLQEVEQLKCIEPIVKWATLVMNPARIPEYLNRAYNLAASGRPGPVYLEIPADVLSGEVEVPEKPYAITPMPGPAGAEESAVAAAVDMLAAAEQPIVIAGSGAYYGHAEEALKNFAETSGIPIFTMSMGRGVLPETHPLCFGPAIVTRPGAAFNTLPKADVVLLLGTRINLFLGHGKVLSNNTKIIQVDVAENEPGRNRAIDLPIIAGARDFCAKAATIWKDKVGGVKFEEWTKQIAADHTIGKSMYEPMFTSDQTPILPLRLAREIDTFVGDEGFVIADGGDNQIWTGMARTNNVAGTYLDSGLFGCLGVGIPFALAAKIANPDKKVVLSIGDGSVGFNFMEFNTAIRKNIPIIVVVANDCGWGMIRHSQELRYGPANAHCTELGDAPYHELVSALGGYGELVTEPAEITPALERALASGKVACLNIMVDPAVISPGSVALAEISKGGGY